MIEKQILEDQNYRYLPLSDKYVQQYLYLQRKRIDLKEETYLMSEEDKEQKHKEGIDEAIRCSLDGLTLIAMLKKSNTIVGFCMNLNWNKVDWYASVIGGGKLILHREFIETFYGHCKSAIWIEELYVTPQYRGQGVGTNLVRATIKMAKRMKAGENMQTALTQLTSDPLPKIPVPNAVVGIFKTRNSKKIRDKLLFGSTRLGRMTDLTILTFSYLPI